MNLRTFAAALVVVLSIHTVSAQAEAPASGIDASLVSVAPSHRLEGLDMVWQQLNRCSAAALAIQLSYYENWDGDYTTTIRGLNPHSEDVSVRLDEMVSFVQAYGLKGVERLGGTIDLLRLLVANGFPVLVENTYYDGDDLNRDWMSHNRVITGYDDALGVLYAFDSLLGAGDDGMGRPIAYDEFDTRWRAFNRDFFIVYQPGDEPLLQALLGERYWDADANAAWTLAQAQAEVEGDNPDSYASFNMGTALTRLGRYEEAAAAFDRARATGLPWRMFWYQFEAYEAYLQLGRYDDVMTLARDVISATPGVEESYYYIARAYEAQGDRDRAIANLEVAVMRRSGYSAAMDLLAQLQGQPS